MLESIYIDMTIYRTYDIRGVVPTELNETITLEIGRKFASHTNFSEIVVGTDCRLSSPALKAALIKGLTSSGVSVIDIGQVATPILYFAIRHLKKDGGVMVTASHNPKEYNGFKLVGKDIPISPSDFKDIIPSRNGNGSNQTKNISEDYLSAIRNAVSLPRKLKVVIDAGNGMAGPFAPALFRKLGCDVVELYCTPDGSFPNHHPDPTKPENMTILADAVVKNKADLGLGFDGDSDRLGVIDDKGKQLTGDQLIILLAKDILAKKKGAKILSEPKISLSFFEEIRKSGGVPVLEMTGHTHIKKRMFEDDIPFAGELSGHIFYKEWGFDDAIFVSAKVAELVSKSGEKLSDVAKTIPVYFATPEFRLHCPEEKKEQIISSIRKELEKKYEVLAIDGARVTIGDGWGLIRASNTEPVLSLRFEGKTKNDLDLVRKVFEEQLEKFGLAVPA